MPKTKDPYPDAVHSGPLRTIERVDGWYVFTPYCGTRNPDDVKCPMGPFVTQEAAIKFAEHTVKEEMRSA